MNKDYSIQVTPLAENQILQIAQNIIEEFQAPETASGSRQNRAGTIKAERNAGEDNAGFI